ncbi:DUF7507 domain-containing protein [Actinoplanes aureus]|uniref:DUF11 domain-containing protein n=1 Tax=Actinoplanes aureus TaxID=2792083 RepID=A0A931G2P7_9ACTN|nr:DUF11 domain-containing protein [Actinoplanes aureus]MBG0567957.1 DUF11 domain-containing protein [Actinoplanes aureus]
MLASLWLVLPEALTGPARAAQTSCASPVTLANGDFEAPVIPAATMQLIKEGDMPGWLTTAQDNVFELWREVRQGFTSGSGHQFVELNANFVSQLYQDLPTTPGVTLRWELKHRGRLGTDVMAVKIGPPPVGNAPFAPNQSTTISNGAAAWGTSSGIYTVPPGQTRTRFGFDSISTAQNKPTYGNFLDGISFGTASCLESTTTVSSVSGGATANVGDVLTYTVNTQNKGGNPAKAVVMTDDLPANVTFVPGSIRSLTGSSSNTVTDDADSDTGEYDAASRTVRVRAGAGAGSAAGGAVPVAESRSFSYQVRVTAAAATSTLVNEAAVTYRDDLTGSTLTSISSSASTVVAAAANLAITAVVAAPGVVAGRTATTDITIVNNGPDTANAVQASAAVPFGIVNVTASSSPGACTVNAPAVTCSIGSLPAGATASMTVSGLVIPQATPGAQATLTASVASSTFEISQADNATSVSDTVATLTDLDVGMTYSPAQPVAGDTVTYRATVTNNGPSTALGVTLTDPITTGSTFSSANPAGAGSCTYVGSILRTLTCTWPSLAAGATTWVDVLVELGNESDSIHNVASVTSSTPESDVTDNNASVKAQSTSRANLGVRLTLEQSTAKPGDEVPFTLVVTNHGPSTATNVSFNTVVPAGFTIVRAASPFCTATACTIQELPSGAVIPIRGKAVVGPAAAAGVQQASTTIISPTTDPVPGNETSVVSFTIELEADLRVSQVLSNSTTPADPLVAGEQVRGVVTVTNDGTTRAEGVVLRQAVPAGRPVPTANPSAGSCDFQGTRAPDGTTADGGTYVCNLPTLASTGTTSWEIVFDGVLLSAGYSNTVYTRTATVSATSPDPDASDNTVVTTRQVERRSDLRVTKALTPGPPLVQTGDVGFVITVRNLGPSDAAGVLLREDPPAGLLLVRGVPSAGSYDDAALTWSLPNLTVAEGSQTLTIDGVAQGSGTLVVWTRVVASGSTDPDSGNNATSAAVTAAAAAPSLSVSVQATLNPASAIGAGVGTTLGYVYRVTNTGNLALNQLTATGTRGVAGVCGNTTLAPGAFTDCAAGGYTVTSGDITSGAPIGNTVTVTAASVVDAGPVQYARVTSSVPVVVARPSLVAVVTPKVMTAGHQYAAAVTDEIEYDYRVTNNGNVEMVDIALTDTKTGPVTCLGQTTLAIGAAMTCSTLPGAGYPVTQPDVDAGLPIIDAASISAKQSGSTTTETYGPFHASVTVAPPAPALSIAVTSPITTPVAAGGAVTYRYTLRNTGNVTINHLAVIDSKVSGNDCPTSIDAGDTVTCESAPAQPYVVTQGDIDAGGPLHNDTIVTGQGVTPGSATAAAEGGASVTVVAARPDLSITSTTSITPAQHVSGVVPGDRIDVDYRVRNTGNVTMHDITVSDTLAGSGSCPGTDLAVGDDMVCTAAPYTVTQADMDRGTISSAARVRGRGPLQTEAVEYGTTPVSVTVSYGSPALILTAAATVSPAGHRTAVDEGDEIGYEYVVTNAGMVTMRQIEVVDSRFGRADCPGTVLAPGDSLVCGSAQVYTVTSDDVDAGGEIVNEVSVAGRTPGGQDVAYPPVLVGVGVLVSEPALRARIIPVVEPAAHQNAAEAGDTLTFRYEVVNAGNQPMTGIAVAAGRGGTVRCPATSLGLRESMICTGPAYTVTRDDVDAGVPITDRVTLTGSGPGSGGPRTFGPFEGSAGVVAARPALTLEMSAGVFVAAQGSDVQAGNLIRYGYTVTNSGNVTVRDLVVVDPLVGSVTCRATELAAGEDTGCTADRPYRVTQADVDAARPLQARAYARGTWSGANRAVASGQARTSVPVVASSPRLSAAQQAAWSDTDGDGELSTRDEVVSTVLVTNTGNVTLVNVRVTGLPAAVACPGTRIAPSGSMTCVSGVYHLSAADITRGRHTYEVKVSGDLTVADSPGAEARAPSTVVVPAGPKSSAPPSPAPAPGTVPVTGGPGQPTMVIGFAMIITGIALLLLPRRPR